MKKILITLLICAPVFAFSQTETAIRDYYQDINKKIQDSKNGLENALYCNEMVLNKNMKSWPAQGVYQDSTNFWYDDDPNHLSTKDRDPKVVLVKVTVNRRTASLVTSEEYLYKAGRLVFFFSSEGEEGKLRETRIWFNEKGTFKSSVKADDKELSAKQLANAEYADFRPRTTNVIKYAKNYQGLFLKAMMDQ